MTFLIQADCVFYTYFATVLAASANTVLHYLYGVQTFLETNKLSANAEDLAPWGLLSHEVWRWGIFQLVKKLKHINGFRKCIAVQGARHWVLTEAT
jgi:hypothetical protein